MSGLAAPTGVGRRRREAGPPAYLDGQLPVTWRQEAGKGAQNSSFWPGVEGQNGRTRRQVGELIGSTTFCLPFYLFQQFMPAFCPMEGGREEGQKEG